MSEHKMIKQLNRILKMQYQQKRASRPHKNRRCFKRRDWHNWLLSLGRECMAPISEAEKMAIHHQEGG